MIVSETEIAATAKIAADVLRERGHVKHTLQDQYGRVCLLGALNTAMTGDPRRQVCFTSAGAGVVSAMVNNLGLSVHCDCCGPEYELVEWNNAVERTAEEVIAAFDAVGNVGQQTDFELAAGSEQ